MNITPLNNEDEKIKNQSTLRPQPPDQEDKGSTVDEQLNLDTQVDASSIYPTPVSAPSYETPHRLDEASENNVVMNKKNIIIITLIGVYIVLVPILSLAMSYFQLNSVSYEYISLVESGLLSPLAIFYILASIIVGVGIIRRKELARIVVLVIVGIQIAIAIFGIVAYTLTAKASDGTTYTQRSLLSFDGEVEGRASPAKDKDKQQGQREVQSQDSNSSTAATSLNYASLRTTAIIFNILFNVAIFILLTRKGVKRLFS